MLIPLPVIWNYVQKNENRAIEVVEMFLIQQGSVTSLTMQPDVHRSSRF